jgi:hypothetical protein
MAMVDWHRRSAFCKLLWKIRPTRYRDYNEVGRCFEDGGIISCDQSCLAMYLDMSTRILYVMGGVDVGLGLG